MTGGGDWPAPEPRGGMLALLPVARQEFSRHAVGYAALFACIALTALAVGILLPKKYASTTTILVEQSNIITPLMEGRAVPTGVANRATIAREVAFSRRVMSEVLKTGGWMAGRPTPLQQARLIEQITDRTQVTTPRENLIQVSYTDSQPQRAYEVTRRLAELVIRESLATKEQESRDAYQFITSQVEQYHAKLTEAEGTRWHLQPIPPERAAGARQSNRPGALAIAPHRQRGRRAAPAAHGGPATLSTPVPAPVS